MVGKGRENTGTTEKHRNIAVFSLVMPDSAAGSSLQRSSVAPAAQAASFGATLRAQGRHRRPSPKAGAEYRDVFLHRKCQPLVASAASQDTTSARDASNAILPRKDTKMVPWA